MVIIFIMGVVESVFIFKPVFEKDSQIPHARKGVLDLRRWDLEQDGYLRLDGEWEFYPGRLLRPGEFGDGKRKEYIEVPSGWETRKFGKKHLSPLGAATYRLIIQTGPSQIKRDYGVKTSLIRLSNAIFINGVLYESCGKPALDRHHYIPGNQPKVIYFHPESGRVELVIQVANFDYVTGAGILGPIYFGKRAEIQHLREKALVNDWIMIIGFFLMGLIFVSVYVQSGKEPALLFLGLNCFARGFWSFTHGEKTLYWVMPHLSFYILGKIQYLTVTTFSAFLVLYIYYTFKNTAHKTMVQIFTGICIVMSLLGLIISLKTHSQLDPLLAVLCLMAMLYTIYLLIRNTVSRVEEAGYLIVSAFSMFLYNIIYSLNVFGKVDIGLVPPFEPFVFILSQAFLHSMRFSAAFRKVEELSENLIAAHRIKDEFLAKTSHEFRIPLIGIINISQTLIDGVDGKLTRVQEDNLTLITTIAKRLSWLVNDIQDLVKMQNRELSINPVALDIKPLVQLIFGFFKYNMAGKNLVLVERIPDNLPPVMVDENRMKQILYNLVDNAIKFTGSGKVEIGAGMEVEQMRIWIEDTGPGIPDDIIKDVFTPYQHNQTSHPGGSAGTGLGLTIVKELVELHGGQIGAENIHPGARVYFTLPVAAHSQLEESHIFQSLSILHEEPVAIKTPYIIDSGGLYTILVADDDSADLRILINAFTTENYNIIAVKNGKEALEMLEKNKGIDILVLDLMMPGVSGYEVCKKIREKFSLSELPVLILTTANQMMDITASYEAGANDFLAKPYDVSQLKFKIRSLIMMKQSALDARNLEVAFLQAQIKPHFLFNTFNTIMSLSYKEVEKAREVIASLADYLRESFDFSNAQDLVPLEKELELVKAYLVIEKARYKERLTVEFDFEDIDSIMIPPITLQTLIENAIKHGIGTRVNGGTIRTGGRRFHGHYLIYVEDDGRGMDEQKLQGLFSENGIKTGVGLRNIQHRLIRYFGEGVTVTSRLESGTRIEIRIPIS
jgi:signal transduction histidine kinase